jgi:hypothetical protein
MDDEQIECTCGHLRHEHGGDVKYPGSTACQIEDCDCTSFEPYEVEE